MLKIKEKLTGIVVKYLDLGYGFIRVDDGDVDYFFHVKEFTPRIKNIFLGTKVSFVPHMTDKGLQATQCVITS